MSDARPDPATLSALHDLSNRYWAMTDATIELDIGQLFTADGILTLGTLELSGRDAIIRFFAERARTNNDTARTTRHVATNIMVSAIAPDLIHMRATVLVFSGSGMLPLPVAAPSGIADFEDVCVPVGNAWAYRRRTAKTIFIGEGAPSFARSES